MTALTVCSKSSWVPSIRREHAFVHLALGRGLEVVFVEPPMDIRTLRSAHPLRYSAALGGTACPPSERGLKVVARSSPIPGHRNRLAEEIDTALLRRVLASQADDAAPTICNLPWQWSAVADRGRKVFDCADDWTRLFPASRHPRFLELFRRIADEADEVVVASGDLAHLFAGRTVKVVPNGTDRAAIAPSVVPRPNRCCLVYIGTLSERFDVSIVTDVLRALPDWRLDVYGPCRYAGRGDRPAPELVAMLAAFADRVRWHGTIPRSAVPGAIDGADVVIVPIRADMAEGQSSMKLYDIAARGRPPVAARGVSSSGGEVPPGTHIAETLDEWVAGITASAVEPDGRAEARLAWARSNTWEHRWPEWAKSAFGDALVAPGVGNA